MRTSARGVATVYTGWPKSVYSPIVQKKNQQQNLTANRGLRHFARAADAPPWIAGPCRSGVQPVVLATRLPSANMAAPRPPPPKKKPSLAEE
jgi:hypothetical protein